MSQHFRWSGEKTKARNHQRPQQEVPRTFLNFWCHGCNYEWRGENREVVRCPRCNGIRISSRKLEMVPLPPGSRTLKGDRHIELKTEDNE